ncbi:MAG: NTP transferase domain-containing protein [Planctomycetes bacterium]|nr:NTP transferase domain-containing protein [Planctomycetota bacterium]
MPDRHTDTSASLWVVILAGGSGRRLQPLTRALVGRPLPKQFCSFGRDRSLLQETVRRARPLASPERTVVVVNTPYLELARDQIPELRLVEQPLDRGTAPGVLLPLLHVQRCAPDATVVLLPSDHDISNSQLFLEGLARARRAVEADPSLIVVGGAQPSRPSPDFGWIVPERSVLPYRTPRLFAIRRFVEKPPVAEAERLLEAGALWSTFILVARVSALLAAFRTRLPDVTAFFDRSAHLSRAARRSWLARHYQELPAADFSADLLSHLDRPAVLAWPARLGWADLGTPERLLSWLEREGSLDAAAGDWAPAAADLPSEEAAGTVLRV